MKNEAANAPITFEELAMVMIKPHYKTRTYGRGNHSNENVQIGIKVFRNCIDFALVRLVIGLKSWRADYSQEKN